MLRFRCSIFSRTVVNTLFNSSLTVTAACSSVLFKLPGNSGISVFISVNCSYTSFSLILNSSASLFKRWVNTSAMEDLSFSVISLKHSGQNVQPSSSICRVWYCSKCCGSWLVFVNSSISRCSLSVNCGESKGLSNSTVRSFKFSGSINLPIVHSITCESSDSKYNHISAFTRSRSCS